MKKVIYHPGKFEGEYRVAEIEKNDDGELWFRVKHGVKGKDTTQIAMRIGYDELAGFAYRLEKMLHAGGIGKATIYHAKEGDAYKVGEIEINDKGEMYLRMSEGKAGDKKSRNTISLRLNEDEMAGLWVGVRRILLS